MLEVLLSSKLAASIHQAAESRPKRERDFGRIMHRARKEHEQRQAKHREERLARGLSEKAGSGTPEAAMMMYRAAEGELPYQDRPAKNLGAMIAAVEEAKVERDRRLLAKTPLGASRVGGLPDLPREIEWPTYKGKKLPFLAQINLSDLPAPKNRLLPSDGWLYAFGLFDNDPQHDPNPHAIFVYRGDASTLVRAPHPDKGFVWPDWAGQRIYELVPVTFAPPPKEVRGLDEVGQKAAWLFGEIQWDETPGEIADREFREGDDWINLLGIKSVGSMQWSDAGESYLVIRRSDLERGDFSNVLSTICSS